MTADEQKKLNDQREERLRPYGGNPSNLSLWRMSDIGFETLLAFVKKRAAEKAKPRQELHEL